MPDSVDYVDVMFQVYRAFKLGEGLSVVGDSIAYTRLLAKVDSWFRYTAYHDPHIGDCDIELDYAAHLSASNSNRTTSGTPTTFMRQVS